MLDLVQNAQHSLSQNFHNTNTEHNQIRNTPKHSTQDHVAFLQDPTTSTRTTNKLETALEVIKKLFQLFSLPLGPERFNLFLDPNYSFETLLGTYPEQDQTFILATLSFLSSSAAWFNITPFAQLTALNGIPFEPIDRIALNIVKDRYNDSNPENIRAITSETASLCGSFTQKLSDHASTIPDLRIPRPSAEDTENATVLLQEVITILKA